MLKTASLPDPLYKTVASIDRLKELQPDWDSYGAGTIDLSSREQAKSFIYEISRTLGPEYVSPVVGPTSDGGVALIWRRRGQPKVEVFFSPQQQSRFVVFRNRELLAKGPLGKDLAFLKKYITL